MVTIISTKPYQPIIVLMGLLSSLIVNGCRSLPVSETGSPYWEHTEVRSIEPQEVAERLLRSPWPFILDVRAEEDFAEDGHLKNAMNIPLWELQDQFEEIKPYVKEEVIVTGGKGKLGRMAAMTLGRNGFHNVKAMQGGMRRWMKAFGDSLVVYGKLPF